MEWRPFKRAEVRGRSSPEQFIHSFIPDIYIAPLQETYSEALPAQPRPNRKDFSSLVGRKQANYTTVIYHFIKMVARKALRDEDPANRMNTYLLNLNLT